MTAVFAFCFLPSLPAGAAGFNAETFTLENGLQVVVIPNHRAPVVTHMVWYKFGGGDERAGKSGVAHFLEHLMFKGTPTVPDGQFSAIVKKLGGNDNAFTTHDYTAYYQNIAVKFLPRIMEMEADRMRNLDLEDAQVSAERQVIVEERRQRVDNQPQAKFQEQLMSAVFVNHPYGTPVIGWLHEIEGLTRPDALENYGTWYAPNNAILVVSGAITAAELKPLAEKHYGPLEPAAVPDRLRPQAAPLAAQHRLILEDARVGAPVVTKIYRAPRGSDALEALAEVFGGDPTSRLYRRLVVEKKMAVHAGAAYEPISLDDTTFTFYATPVPGVSPAELEMALDAEALRLAQEGVAPEELQAAKNKKKAALTYYLDSLQGPAILFGRALASGFDMEYLNGWHARIDRLSAEDVNEAARRVFARDNLPVTGILLPAREPATGGKKR